MVTRRRFVSIAAACAAGGLPRLVRSAVEPPVEPVVWRGSAMGALGSMTLLHPDRNHAIALLSACLDEIARLEAILSLYRPDSTLARLNAAGELRDPPHELVELLGIALALSRSSGGAFDPTVQPLYQLYADHYAHPGAAPGGPSPEAIAGALRVVDYRGVEVAADRIRLHGRGMAITLNGIAQGYVTDRVADLLRAASFDDVLIDLGEARALGSGPQGRAWRAAVADPRQPSRTLFELPLGEGPGALSALATSAGYGTRFGPDPRVHHLFDPHSGHSANPWLSVSVAAARATLADGLSTTLAVSPRERAPALLAGHASTRAWLVDASGRTREIGTPA